MKKKYRLPDSDEISAKRLAKLERDEQIEVMRQWFFENYEDPAENTPYEGGYVWIWGGPYDAREELGTEFSDVVPEDVIEELAEELTAECPEWAKQPDPSDLDESLFQAVAGNKTPFATFTCELASVAKLLELPIGKDVRPALHRLLYANVITAVETYLSDTFINAVLDDNVRLRKLFETTPAFKQETVKRSEVFQEVKEARQRAKTYLLDLVWHKVKQVKPLYGDTLGVELRTRLADVARAVEIRHDIVHRSGIDKEGNAHVIKATKVEALMNAAHEFVEDVETQINEWVYKSTAEDAAR